MTETEIDSKTGLPLLDQETKSKNAKGAIVAGFVINIVFTLIGVGIAWATYKFGSTDKYDSKIA